MADQSASNYPTGGRHRKLKGPAQQHQLPDLPPIPPGYDASDDLEDERRPSDRALLNIGMGMRLKSEDLMKHSNLVSLMTLL